MRSNAEIINGCRLIGVTDDCFTSIPLIQNNVCCNGATEDSDPYYDLLIVLQQSSDTFKDQRGLVMTMNLSSQESLPQMR